MTIKETERLVRVEEKQTAMQEDIESLKAQVGKIDDKLEHQSTKINDKLDAINSTLDNLMGGKKALIWITGVALTIAGLAIALVNSIRNH